MPATYWRSECIETASTFTFGISARICRVASTPFSSGIPMSMITRSGDSSRARRTAIRPLLASPTMSRPGRVANSVRSPSQNSRWLSASRILIALPPRSMV